MRSTPGDSNETAPPTELPPPDPSPEMIGGYRVVREIGQGGMGRVLEVEDPRAGRNVALKVMRPALADDPGAKARFLREARAVAGLHHDNVVSIYHVDEDQGRPFIVMPLLEGETLEQRLTREGKLPVADAVRVGIETALGLGAAHARGLVHRDIKPANLWLEAPTGRVKVLDFGLARPAAGDGLSLAGSLCGTPGYMSPEQAAGQAVDARGDLFSLGCVLYEVLTGQRAFPGPLAEALRAAAERDPRPPAELRPGLPEGLSPLVVRLLAKSPDARPQSATEVERALRDMEAGVAPEAVTRPRAAPGPETPALPTPPKPDAKGGEPRLAVSVRAQLLGCGAALTVTLTVLLVMFGPGLWDRPHGPNGRMTGGVKTGAITEEPPLPKYRGAIHVLIEREIDLGVKRLVRLDDVRALPMKPDDKFRIEATVSPPAYLYLIWVDPGKDITPVYPWDPEKGWGSRPAKEEPVGKVSLPAGAADRYTAPKLKKAGVATMVVLARPTPLDVGDDVVKGWFEALPDLPLLKGCEEGAVWFDNYAVVMGEEGRPRTFKVVGTDDPFAAWQGKLQKAVGDRAAFQTAVSFARMEGR